MRPGLGRRVEKHFESESTLGSGVLGLERGTRQITAVCIDASGEKAKATVRARIEQQSSGGNRVLDAFG